MTALVRRFVGRFVRRFVDVRPHEMRGLLWSFVYFLALLTGYYVLRSLRDEMAIAGGVERLPWLFTGTFVVMLAAVPLWSALVARVPRRVILPVVYRFFVVNLLVFFALFQVEGARVWAARAFFVWLSVFNMLAVTVFWSFMADIFRHEQARRLFGFIAVGGSAGAMLGPLVTALLAGVLGPVNLLLLSAALLEVAARCIGRLARWQQETAAAETATAPTTAAAQEEPVGGGALTGIRLVFASPYLLAIAGYTFVAMMLASFGYFTQANLVAGAGMSPGERTALFARIDLAVNVLSAVLQALVTGRLLARGGLPIALGSLPPLGMGALGLLAAAPTVGVSSAMQVLRRTLAFGVANPAMQILFTVVDREQKYKSKAFIDTVISRGGDLVGGWAFTWLLAAGLGIRGASLAAIPIAALWLIVALVVARRHQRLA